jgi:hypothetical protein
MAETARPGWRVPYCTVRYWSGRIGMDGGTGTEMDRQKWSVQNPQGWYGNGSIGADGAQGHAVFG